jgi:hypothetical protein
MGDMNVYLRKSNANVSLRDRELDKKESTGYKMIIDYSNFSISQTEFMH